MNRNRVKLLQRITSALLLVLGASLTYTSYARVGGAGGHGGGGGGYSGGGHGFSGGGGFIGGGGSPSFIVIIIVIIIIIYVIKNKSGGVNTETQAAPLAATLPFPKGLDVNKVSHSFLAIQDAWQRKDLTDVRKWLSDGMYQRLTTQFKMMDILGQSNILSNIRIDNIRVSDTHADGHYQTAEVAISFTMDDNFISNKYPQFNEKYAGDSATEYWTFIKRTDSADEKNLYDNNSCPNCGAPFEVKMGEISRCSNCNTLTNSAAYDWVLSEITQSEAYTGGAGLSNDAGLDQLMQNDPFFAVQRMEDIASNIFMQIMEVFPLNEEKRLSRFADDATEATLLAQKKNLQPFIFDRLYLNSLTLSTYTVADGMVKLYFDMSATYRRVSIQGNKVQMLDNDFVTRNYRMELSRNEKVLTKAGETVYSYECSSCGAPYTDTTEDHCTYCDAPVIDKQRNWVLTGFEWG